MSCSIVKVNGEPNSTLLMEYIMDSEADVSSLPVNVADGSFSYTKDLSCIYVFKGGSWVKANGIEVDPDAIAEAVADWLDEHPEATTTVQDGAISYAKLNSDLKDAVDDVGVLKTAITNVKAVLEPTSKSGSVIALNERSVYADVVRLVGNISAVSVEKDDGTSESYEVPSAITELDYYGGYISDALCNVVTTSKYYKKVGTVAVKDLSWTYNGTFKVFFSTISTKKNGATNVTCEGYPTDASTSSWTNMNDKTCRGWSNSNEFYIKDESYHDATASTAVSNMLAAIGDNIITYELASSAEETISFSMAIDTKGYKNVELTGTGIKSISINEYLLIDADGVYTTIEMLSADSYKFEPLVYTDFTESSALFDYDNCSPSNNGLELVTQSKAYINKYLTFDNWYARANFTLVDDTSVFGFSTQQTTLVNWGLGIYLVDAANGTINLYKQFEGAYSVPTVVASEQIGFPLVEGNDYVLEVRKIGWKHYFSICDTKTLTRTIVSFDALHVSATDRCGLAHGGFGVICISGLVAAKNLTYETQFVRNTRAMFVGDSITEDAPENGTLDNRWCAMLKDNYFGGNAIIMGRSNGIAYDANLRLTDAIGLGIKPEVIIVLIGTNNRIAEDKVADWKRGIVEIYEQIVDVGAVPVICVPPIPANYQSAILEMRDFILAKGWNTIRFDIALSVNRDGSTYNSAVFTDGVHPNELGEKLMYEQAIFDLGSI